MRGIPDPKGFHGDGNEVAIAWRQEARRLDAALTAAQERIAELERNWRRTRGHLNRIVEAGDALADEAKAVQGRMEGGDRYLADAVAAYREAVGGDAKPPRNYGS